MTLSEKVAMVDVLLNENNSSSDINDRVETFLNIAGREIISWRFPDSAGVTEVPSEYEMTQIYAVIAGYTQGGAEGQLSHTENGIGRTFKHADMIDYIRTHVIPYVKVI